MLVRTLKQRANKPVFALHFQLVHVHFVHDCKQNGLENEVKTGCEQAQQLKRPGFQVCAGIKTPWILSLGGGGRAGWGLAGAAAWGRAGDRRAGGGLRAGRI